MSINAARMTQNQSNPLRPPACHKITYMSVAKGRKMRPRSGQIHESKGASTSFGRATQTMNSARRGKTPPSNTNRHPMLAPLVDSWPDPAPASRLRHHSPQVTQRMILIYRAPAPCALCKGLVERDQCDGPMRHVLALVHRVDRT